MKTKTIAINYQIEYAFHQWCVHNHCPNTAEAILEYIKEDMEHRRHHRR